MGFFFCFFFWVKSGEKSKRKPDTKAWFRAFRPFETRYASLKIAANENYFRLFNCQLPKSAPYKIKKKHCPRLVPRATLPRKLPGRSKLSCQVSTIQIKRQLVKAVAGVVKQELRTYSKDKSSAKYYDGDPLSLRSFFNEELLENAREQCL